MAAKIIKLKSADEVHPQPFDEMIRRPNNEPNDPN